MANLGQYNIDNTEWQDLETLTGLVLTPALTYTIQVQNALYLCPKATKPVGSEGFFLTNSDIVYTYTAEENVKVWLKVASNSAVINICL